MTSYTVVESTATTLPITDAQATALREIGGRLASKLGWWGEEASDEDESSEPKSVIRCHRVASGWSVRVADAIGLVAVGDTQLVVQPKIPQPHLLYLLGQSEQIPRPQPEAGDLDTGSSFWELTARWYVRATQDVLRRDLARDYEARTEQLTVVRGRVDPLNTTRDLLRGRIAIHCEFDDYTLNTPLNRLLREASRLVASSSILPWELRRAAVALAIRMDDVDDLRPGDIRYTTDRRTAYYADAIALAKQIIRGVDRNLAYGPSKSWTFLFRTPDAVEEGVRTVLQRALPGRVQKKGMKLTPSHLTLNPDLVFDEGAAIGDVKYKLNKPEWRRSDLYEIVAFATGYGSQRAAIVGFGGGTSADPPTINVGPVSVRHFTWRTEDELLPEEAGAALCTAVGRWLDD
jgi:5-methylcytosine-specific restriction enzyme subunit McrC